MNIFFAIKGVCASFIIGILLKFAGSPAVKYVTTTINTVSMDVGVDDKVGPILVMIDNVFTIVAMIFIIAIPIILMAIAISGGGESFENNPSNRM